MATPVGIDPTTLELTAPRSTNWAIGSLGDKLSDARRRPWWALMLLQYRQRKLYLNTDAVFTRRCRSDTLVLERSRYTSYSSAERGSVWHPKRSEFLLQTETRWKWKKEAPCVLPCIHKESPRSTQMIDRNPFKVWNLSIPWEIIRWYYKENVNPTDVGSLNETSIIVNEIEVSIFCSLFINSVFNHIW